MTVWGVTYVCRYLLIVEGTFSLQFKNILDNLPGLFSDLFVTVSSFHTWREQRDHFHGSLRSYWPLHCGSAQLLVHKVSYSPVRGRKVVINPVLRL